MHTQDLAILSTKTEIPLVISDILSGREQLDGDIQYALHQMISDMGPDTALLSIALSAAKIARIYRHASPAMEVLELDCTRIIDRYAATWIKNANGESLPDDVFECLLGIPEDLEGLAELIEVNNTFLKDKDSEAAALCKILSIQARAHALIAEELIAPSNEISAPTISSEVMADNVIPFPGSITAQQA